MIKIILLSLSVGLLEVILISFIINFILIWDTYVYLYFVVQYLRTIYALINISQDSSVSIHIFNNWKWIYFPSNTCNIYCRGFLCYPYKCLWVHTFLDVWISCLYKRTDVFALIGWAVALVQWRWPVILLVYTCTLTHGYTHMATDTWLHTHGYTHMATHTWLQTHGCTHTDMPAHTHTHTWNTLGNWPSLMCIYIYIYI